MEKRTATIHRATKETDITLTLTLDGSGTCNAKTGIGFFDHMLDAFARHGLFDLDLACQGDLEVDAHHTIEDCGIVLGEAIRQALGDKKAIRRYGSIILPMDEALILCAIDLSGRPYCSFDARFDAPEIGRMPTEMMPDFFSAVAGAAEMNLHIRELAGENSHHIAEGCFKAFAKALDTATSFDSRLGNTVWSTKGSL